MFPQTKLFFGIFVRVFWAEFHFILPQTKSQFSHKRHTVTAEQNCDGEFEV